jgi:putative transposase
MFYNKTTPVFGMNVFDWRKNIFSNTAAESPKASCKNKQKESSIFTDNRFKRSCHKYLFARQSAHHAAQQGHPARYPYKKKKYFPTELVKVKDGFKVDESGKIELSLGIHYGK